MAARAYWQGQIRLALVSIPVEIFPAVKSGATISFRQIHEPTGKPVSYTKTVAGVGPVEPDDIVKGYELSKGNYVYLEEEEIEAVKIESRKTLDLVQFVDHNEIDVFYYEKPYFVVPADDLAEEAYIVVREALRAARKVALGQLSMRGREYLVSIKPCGKGLVMETLRYADEVRRAQTYFTEIGDSKPSEELLELATALIEKKTAPFDPSAFHDRYIEALEQLIEKKAKQKGNRKIIEEPDEPAAGKKSNVIDLMAALKKSVTSEAKEPPAKPAARKAAAKAPAKSAAKPAAKAPARKRG